MAAVTLLEEAPRDRLALLLQHFSELEDEREPWRVVYPLTEVLLLLACATIASCDDFDDIAAWGKHHLDFLRRFSPYSTMASPASAGCARCVNRIDPILFARCFESWMAALWPDRHEFIAIDGKTSRRTHDRRKGPQGPAHAQRLRDQRQADAGADERAGEDQRDHRHPRPARSSGRDQDNSKAPSSPSTPWAARSRSPTRSSNTRPIFCWR